jgi:hypothetical protein
MRRRLSNVSSDPFADGNSPGARFQPSVLASPTKHSPLRSSSTTAAKTLRNAPQNVFYSGISVKGVSNNPDKPNQDSMIMHQLPSGEVVLGVFDVSFLFVLTLIPSCILSHLLLSSIYRMLISSGTTLITCYILDVVPFTP